eukprot:164050-Pyramimonas_sp.AAC.1
MGVAYGSTTMSFLRGEGGGNAEGLGWRRGGQVLFARVDGHLLPRPVRAPAARRGHLLFVAPGEGGAHPVSQHLEPDAVFGVLE